MSRNKKISSHSKGFLSGTHAEASSWRPRVAEAETPIFISGKEMPSSWKSIGPISLQGVPGSNASKEGPVVNLVIKPKESYGAFAEMHPSAISELNSSSLLQSSGPLHLMLASGSDVVLSIRVNESLSPGTICMDEAQRLSLHVLPGDHHQFRLFIPPPDEPHELVELSAEVHILSSSSSSATNNQHQTIKGQVEVDASLLSREIVRVHFSRWLSINEWIVLPSFNGLDLVVRVTEAHTLDRQERDEAIGYHCYRGCLTSTTRIYLSPRYHSHEGREAVAAQGMMQSLSLAGSIHRGGPSDEEKCGEKSAIAGGLRLINALQPPTSHHNPNMVHIVTNDEECFPVKKKLLRSCLTLTKVVRDTAASSSCSVPSQLQSVNVDVDCLTFDRVLLFLEAHTLNKPIPAWSLHLIDDLYVAAERLSCKPLLDHCMERLGSKGQLKIYSLDEIERGNSNGEVLLILDGMVLDVKVWLPEHPGGSTIIPTQSLNCDCARFFEVYHASRESFLYLRDFYSGEVRPEDRSKVQLGGGGEPPSVDFLVQLREYSDGFRIKLGPNDTVLHGTGKDKFKSF
jgi:hypothetical protein